MRIRIFNAHFEGYAHFDTLCAFMSAFALIFGGRFSPKLFSFPISLAVSKLGAAFLML